MKLKSLSSLAVIQLLGLVMNSGMVFTANAMPLVSNISEPTKVGGTTIISTDALWAAQSFATDANSYTLTSVSLVAGKYNGVGNIIAELRAGTIDSIGSTLGSFVEPVVPTGSPAMLTLVPTLGTTLSLAPSTYYWLIFGTTGGATFGLDYAKGNNLSGSGSLGNYAYSQDKGVTWGSFNSDDLYKIEVDVAAVNAVPEPAVIWLFGLALVSVLSLPRIGQRMLVAQ